MYFSRVTLREDIDAAELVRWALRDRYAVHQLVWRLFDGSSGQRRDFLFRDEFGERRACYIVSARPPEDREGIWHVESKPYTPRLRAGERLGFQLRANPVRSARDDSGRVKRHDVVMDLKTRLKSGGAEEQLPPSQELVQQAGFRWLSERAAKHGFRLEESAVRTDGYRQHRLHKGRDRAPIRLSTLDYAGVLTVTDPDSLLQALYGGIGPAKAFGCGLLMVRRL